MIPNPTRRIVAAALLSLLVPCVAAAERTMRMAVTTSFEASGLADVLLPAIEADTGVAVQLVVVGTGQALRLGAAGDVDAVLVHSREAEEAFVAQGHAPHRREVMYNDFVLVGPSDDPAGASRAETAAGALTAVAEAGAAFVSRGDDSGTHKAELALWSRAGLEPEAFGRWYRETGSGMGAALNTAAGMGAYVLSDRASWLAEGRRGLSILFEGDPALFNQYAYLPVADARHPEAAAMVEAWLTSERAATLIDGHRVGGERLFTFNAEPRPDE